MSIASRIRSGLPLFQRIIKADSSPSFANGLRSYSIQAKATEKKVKVPLALFGGSGNYATALFTAASRANALEKVESELKDVVAASKKTVLAHNGRLKNMELIAKRFVELTMAHRGEVKVIVTTVIPIPAQEEKEVIQALKEMVPNAKSIKIEQKIDPSILGGLVIEFNQKVYDTSIRTRAKKMAQYLREPLDFENF